MWCFSCTSKSLRLALSPPFRNQYNEIKCSAFATVFANLAISYLPIFPLVHTYLPISYCFIPICLFPIGSYLSAYFLLAHTYLRLVHTSLQYCLTSSNTKPLSINEKRSNKKKARLEFNLSARTKSWRKKKDREFKKTQRKKRHLTDSSSWHSTSLGYRFPRWIKRLMYSIARWMVFTSNEEPVIRGFARKKERKKERKKK